MARLLAAEFHADVNPAGDGDWPPHSIWADSTVILVGLSGHVSCLELYPALDQRDAMYPVLQAAFAPRDGPWLRDDLLALDRDINLICPPNDESVGVDFRAWRDNGGGRNVKLLFLRRLAR